MKINDTENIMCIEKIIFTLRHDVDIVRIAHASFLYEYLPLQLEQWRDSDFNYSADLHRFLCDIYEKESSLEIFFERLYGDMRKYVCCRRRGSQKCKLSDDMWPYEGCKMCTEFLDNGIKNKFTACVNSIGYSVDSEGFVTSGTSQVLDPEIIVSEIKREDKFDIINTILPPDIIKKGAEMSEVYALLYCIENSLRIFIEKCCKDKLGNNFFTQINIPNELKNKITNRKVAASKHKWLPLRGNNDLYYLDLSDLGNIIQRNWSIFETYFPNQNWIIGKIDDISECRNLIAHNSYIEDDEKVSLSVEYKKILKQISRVLNS